MRKVQFKDFYRIGRVRISITDEDDAINRIKKFIRGGVTGYICVSNLRTVVIANKDDAYQEVMEHSLMNLPDGTPLVWCGHWWGLKEVERACGPHIFPQMLKDKDADLRHFFLGDTDETLDRVAQKAEIEFGATVVGSYSPPFKPLEEYDIKAMAKMINESGANVVWTALTAPKQDILNSMITPHLNNGIVMIGVGAAFRSVLGMLKQPDGIMQKIGLAGLVFKRPEITWKEKIRWYCKHFVYLLKYYMIIHWRRIVGRNYWEYISKI